MTKGRRFARLTRAVFGVQGVEVTMAGSAERPKAKRGTPIFCEGLEQRVLLSAVTSWTTVGDGAGGAFFSPSINPANGNEIYVGTDQTDEYHTTNGATSWTVVPFQSLQGSTRASVQFTNNPNILYAPGMDNAPVESTNGGATWAPIPHNPTSETECFYVNYNNPNEFFVSSYTTVFYTANGGASYSSVYTNSNGAYVAGAYFNGSNVYLATDAGILTSSDNGTTFSAPSAPGINLTTNQIFSFAGSTAGGVTKFFVTTASTGNVYPGVEGVSEYEDYTGVYSMTVGGGNWALDTTGLPTGDDLAYVVMAQNDINDVYLAGGSVSTGAPVVDKSTNGGASWSAVFLTNNDQNIQTGWEGTGGPDYGWGFGQAAEGITVDASNPNEVMLTDEGAVYLTTNGGTGWVAAYVAPSSLNPAGTDPPVGKAYTGNGLENTSAWNINWANQNDMFVGFTDKTAIMSTDGGNTWSTNYTGLNSASRQWNTIYDTVTQPGTGTEFAAASSVHDMYQWETYWETGKIDAGDGAVMASTNEGNTWTTVHDFGHPVVWETINPNNPDQMYVSVASATSAGGIYVTNDLQDGASATWTELSAPPRTTGFAFNILVLNSGELVVSYAGTMVSNAFTDTSGIFTSTDGGATWTDTTASVAAMQYFDRDITIDPADPTQQTWYVGAWFGSSYEYGTTGGLYKTTNGGATWTLLGTSQTQMKHVTQVAFDPTNDNDMYITTESNGLWYSSNAQAATPTFTLVTSYPFAEPERVYFNPYDPNQVWVASFGYSMVYGYTNPVGPASQVVFAQQPSTTTLNTSITPAVTVDVEDAAGDVITSDNSTVTISLGSGPGTLSGTLTATAVNGIATFSNLKLSAAGTYTLDASDGTLASAVSNSVVINPQPATKAVFIQQPTNIVAGNIISPAVTVALEDSLGNIVTTNTSNVTISINSGPGTLSGTLTVAAVNGVATFNNLSTNGAGSVTFKATDGSLTSGVSSAFTVTAGAAAKLGFSQQPTNVGAGNAITPSVKVNVEDAYGNTVTTDSSTVTLSLNSGPGTLGGTLSVAAVSGVATFSNLTLATPGTDTLKAVDGSLASVVSNNFIVATTYSYTLANLVNFTGTANGKQPEGTLVADSSGNLYGTTYSGGSSNDGTVFEYSATSHTLTTLATFTGAANGVNPEAGLAIDSSGNLYGTTYAGGSSNDGTAFEVAAGTHAFTTLATFTGTANGANPQASLAIDSSGNLYGTTYAGGASNDGTVFELASGTFALTTLVTFTGTANGANPEASLIFDSSGNLYGTTYIGGSGNHGTVFELAAGTHALTTIETFGYATGDGPVGSLVFDVSGNLYGTMEYGGTSGDGGVYELAAGTHAFSDLVLFSGANGQYPTGNVIISGGNLFGTTISGGASGYHGTVFQITLGSNTLTTSESFAYATGDVPIGLYADSSGDIYGVAEAGSTGGAGVLYKMTPTALPASKLAFVQQPTNVAAGSVISPAITVAVEDSSGNIVTGNNSSVTIAINSGPGTLGGTVTVAAVNGVATFNNLTLTTTGAVTLVATDGSLTNSVSGSFNVTAGAASKLVIAQQPTNVAAGSAISPSVIVDVEDANGNLVTTNSSTVTMAINSGPGTLGGTVSVAAVNGVATFSNLTLTTTGAVTLKATDGSLTNVTSSSFNVSAGAAAKLAFIQQPTNVVAGSAISPSVIVDVEDANGNIVTTDGSTVTMSINSGPGTLGGTVSVAAVNGVATFSNLTLTTTGAVTLNAADGSLTNATSGSFNVTPAAAAKLAFAQQPTNVAAGSVISPAVVVDVEDAYGNIVTGDSSTVTLSLNSGPGTLGGTLSVAASGGVATFSNVTLTTTGAVTLNATDGSLTNVVSSSFNVTPGAAAKLAFVQQPTNVNAGSVISPAVTVAVEDANGNIVTSNASSVTLSINSGPGTLGGTLTVAAVSGVATFSNLTLSAAGSVTLAAADGSLTNTVSSSFTVAGVTYTQSTLATFTPTTGKTPEGALVADSSGNLYGVTNLGGSSNDGTVFEYSATSHTITTLVTFIGANGANPLAGLLIDSSGNLFGTTKAGGSSSDGTVFEVAAGTHALTTLVTFTGTANGANPEANLIFDSSGNLYGTTYAGGTNNDGTVFELASGTYALTTLVTFAGTSNGANPEAGLVFDSSGNLYGTTYSGGTGIHDGTVFELAAGTYALTTLKSFTYATGDNPAGSLVLDSSGNIYGTVEYGTTSDDGTLFELSAGTHTLSTLVGFTGTNGAYPTGNLILYGGNLFGTTISGGTGTRGTTFEYSLASSTLTDLATFSNSATGAGPSGLYIDSSGDLFGACTGGGTSYYGTLYELIA